jgi:hypothetical protein
MLANDNAVESVLDLDTVLPLPSGWTRLWGWDELRNPDWLPERLTRVEGCEKCGGAFVEIDAVKLGGTLIEGLDASKGTVRGLQKITGVRYICCDGHATCHEPLPYWALPVVGVAAIFAAALYRKGGLPHE